ncbi:cytochrome b-c1 complex subunit 6, mitochondrial-like isoform X2 [Portunus trituberculatus]|uniref:cytochrome b-c1 complex subunit 6, mitochondrial-like isoform X2 n=1 Tax=Portunus trituberculatus TaxID=210409 RepID=UPI001E1CF8E7|nr:cytochrome b-c1 complex subunit 6, mitochondrial-like isoform X2 [Portunus trituberculatus]
MAIDDIKVHNDDPEEEEDPLDDLKESCGTSNHCAHLNEKLTTCNDRVNSRSKTEETCSEELFDYLHCVDHCLTESLFKKLK